MSQIKQNRFLKLNEPNYDSASSIGDIEIDHSSPDEEQTVGTRFFEDSVDGVDSCFSGSCDSVGSDEEQQASAVPAKEHLLHTKWSLCYSDKEDKKLQEAQGNFSDDHACVFECTTIQEFFNGVNHIKTPTQLKYRSSPTYYFFRDGIKPEWEDEANADGGMLRIIFKQHERSEYLDIFWFEMLLAIIGEQLPHTDLITGLILQRRAKEDRLCLWLRKSTELEQKTLATAMVKLLNMAENASIPFLPHGEHKQNIEYRQSRSNGASGSIEGNGGWSNSNSRRGSKFNFDRQGSIGFGGARDSMGGNRARYQIALQGN